MAAKKFKDTDNKNIEEIEEEENSPPDVECDDDEDDVIDLADNQSSEDLADWLSDSPRAEIGAVAVWLRNHYEDDFPIEGSKSTLLYAISKADADWVSDAIRAIFDVQS